MENPTKSAGWTPWQWAGLLALALPVGSYSIIACVVALATLPDALRDPVVLFRVSCTVAITMLGALALARGRHNRAAGLLGVILLSLATQVLLFLGQATKITPGVEVDVSTLAASTVAALALIVVRSASIAFFWPLFSLEISGGPASREQLRFVQGLAALFALMPMAAIWAGQIQGKPTLSAAIWTTTIVGNQALGYWILLANYRRSDAVGRNRIKFAFVAFVLFLVSSVATVLTQVGDQPVFAPLTPAFSLTATALLAYAALRRDLFDFGFVLNRTLVYAAVSFILLAGFGLAEWSVENLLPEAWEESGPLISAGIALALFFSFHHLRDWVEHHVERLFFGTWHRNEAELRRFIAAAGHFDQGTALRRAFADELSRFAQGAQAALYLRGPEGSYALQAGNLDEAPAILAADERAFALMRAERRPMNIAQARSALPGVLALPMLDQGTLAGFALLTGKPDRSAYRPDEVAVLGWAAEQVGFALQAQHVRELEATIAGLNAQVATLSVDRDRLGALLAGPATRQTDGAKRRSRKVSESSSISPAK
jgi:GAF domain-containing protein